MSNQMWGGRFASGPDAIMEEINASIGFDKILAPQDIAGSLAHVAMLAKTGIIDEADATAIAEGLTIIRGEIENGDMVFERSLEDIHMNIESRLAAKLGPAAGRLHTARSRNDQVAVDFRLWVRDTVDQLIRQIAALQQAFAIRALEHAGSVMPGFTHMQSAQPVTFGHHLLAYVEMLGRDRSRFADARRRMNECPLGAAALAGTSFPDRSARHRRGAGVRTADRQFPRQRLGSRLRARGPGRGGDLRDPPVALRRRDRALGDAAVRVRRPVRQVLDRLVDHAAEAQPRRGRAGARQVRACHRRADGLLVVMKGLPLAYSKDMQEDKEGVFDALQTLSLCLAAMTGMVEDLAPDTRRMEAAAGAGFATATDLADWLVRELGMPFRDAHHVTGRLVALAAARNLGLEQLSLEDLQGIEPRLTQAVFEVLGVGNSVASRTSYGGTAPDNVRAQAARWLAALGDEPH